MKTYDKEIKNNNEDVNTMKTHINHDDIEKRMDHTISNLVDTILNKRTDADFEERMSRITADFAEEMFQAVLFKAQAN